MYDDVSERIEEVSSEQGVMLMNADDDGNNDFEVSGDYCLTCWQEITHTNV